MVVGRAIAVGDVAANQRLAASSEISYTVAKFSNEFNNENQEGHDVRNIFNTQLQAVAKKKLYQYYRKRKSHTQITLASQCCSAIGRDKKGWLPRIIKG